MGLQEASAVQKGCQKMIGPLRFLSFLQIAEISLLLK